MDLRDLRYFLTIGECGHVGMAAARLHRTQPALTGCVRRLESHFGAQLVEPEGRGIRLTEAGHALMAWASRLLSNEEDARRQLGLLTQGLAGDVRIGVIPAAAHLLLPRVSPRASRELPQVRLLVRIGTGDELVSLLDGGKVDLAVVTQRQVPPTIETRPLGADRIVVVAASSHPLCAGGKTRRGKRTDAVDPKDLLRYPWVLQPHGSPTRDWLERRLLELGLPSPTVHLESNMLPMLPSLIADTELLGFASSHHAVAAQQHGVLREIGVPALEMHRQTSIATRRDAYLSPAAMRIREFFTAAAQRLYGAKP